LGRIPTVDQRWTPKKEWIEKANAAVGAKKRERGRALVEKFHESRYM